MLYVKTHQLNIELTIKWKVPAQLRVLRQALEGNRKIKQRYPSACICYSVRLPWWGEEFFSGPIKTRTTETS